VKPFRPLFSGYTSRVGAIVALATLVGALIAVPLAGWAQTPSPEPVEAYPTNAALLDVERPQDPEIAAVWDVVFPADLPDSIDGLKWRKRVVLVFSDSPFNPLFDQQIKSLQSDPAPLAERDVVVLADADPAGQSALRDRFHPRGFMLVLIGKDGQIKLRKPLPWDVREISRAIDKTPLRQQELRDQRQSGG
jgi:hypothetical protein